MLNYKIQLPDDICAKLSLMSDKNNTTVEHVIERIVNAAVTLYRLADWMDIRSG